MVSTRFVLARCIDLHPLYTLREGRENADFPGIILDFPSMQLISNVDYFFAIDIIKCVSQNCTSLKDAVNALLSE